MNVYIHGIFQVVNKYYNKGYKQYSFCFGNKRSLIKIGQACSCFLLDEKSGHGWDCTLEESCYVLSPFKDGFQIS